MQQVVFRLPIYFFSDEGIPISSFGLMLVIAFVVCLFLGLRWGPKEDIPSSVVQDLSVLFILSGFIGARSAYIIFHLHPKSIGEFFVQLPRIWEGGIILYGSIIGGLLAFLVYYYVSLRHKNIPLLKLADFVAPLLAIGLCFGRIGCLLNGCCYGGVASEGNMSVPFPMSAAVRQGLVEKGYQTHAGFLVKEQSGPPVVSLVTPDSPAQKSGLISGDTILAVNGNRVLSTVNETGDVTRQDNLLDQLISQWPRGENEVRLKVRRDAEEITLPPFSPYTIGVHPAQLYETISMILIFFVLLAFYPLRQRYGQVTALLMICYAMHRYLNEKLRVDDRPEGFEQYVSVLLLAAGLLWMAWLTFWSKSEKVSKAV